MSIAARARLAISDSWLSQALYADWKNVYVRRPPKPGNRPVKCR
ncbi:MAG: hypothetical protein ACLQG3_01755 [Terracidiphilus sp.]